MQSYYILITAIILVKTVLSYRILLLPTPFVSHMNYFEPLAISLKNAHHEPYIVLNDAYKQTNNLKRSHVEILTYNGHDKCVLDTKEFYKLVTDSMIDNEGDPGVLGKIVAPAMAEECDKFLLDKELFEKAKKLKFHLAIVDGLFFARCLYLFPAELQIPYVTLTTFQDFWQARVPALPSFVPFHYSAFGEDMSLLERMGNVFINTFFAISTSSPPLSKKIADRYEKSSKQFSSLIKQSKLWLMNTDIAVDYAKPTLPNIIHIGGLGLKEAKALPNDLETFINSSSDGIIVVSFGSVISQLRDAIIEKLLLAFKNLPYKIIWRLPNSKQFQIPDNVMALDWIPQNDLLGHPKTKLFVTHCGNNGQFEALYHAVPMVGLPIFADQIYNARRVEWKRYGRRLSMHSFQSAELKRVMLQVIEDENILKSIKKGSEILKSWPMNANQRAIFWLEHVIKFGDDHLRSFGIGMPWYSYVMLDVFLAYVILLGLIAVALFFIGKFIFEKIMKYFSMKKSYKSKHQ